LKRNEKTALDDKGRIALGSARTLKGPFNAHGIEVFQKKGLRYNCIEENGVRFVVWAAPGRAIRRGPKKSRAFHQKKSRKKGGGGNDGNRPG